MADYYDAQILQALNEILTELRKLTTEPERTVADYTLVGQGATVQKITERAYGRSVPLGYEPEILPMRDIVWDPDK